MKKDGDADVKGSGHSEYNIVGVARIMVKYEEFSYRDCKKKKIRYSRVSDKIVNIVLTVSVMLVQIIRRIPLLETGLYKK